MSLKCACSECDGTGEVPCPECDGKGTVPVTIEKLKLDRDWEHFDELKLLQQDAKRVQKQALELCRIRPEHTESYRNQLKACIDELDAMAEPLIEPK